MTQGTPVHARILLVALIVAGEAAAQVRIGPPIRVDRGAGQRACNEMTRSTSFADPLVSLGGYNDYRDPAGVRTMFSLTQDGGETWTEELVRPPLAFQSPVEGDPMTAADPDTGDLWAGGIAFSSTGGIYAARRDAVTGQFGPSVMIQAAPNVDKGWMAAGPAPGNPSQRRVYCAYNLGVARSSDRGQTWQGPVNLGVGAGFLPRVAPDGTVHVAYFSFNQGLQHRLRSSSDGGVTWGPPTVIADRLDVLPAAHFPGSFRTPVFQGFAIHPTDSSRLYSVYADTTSIVQGEADVDVYFTRSTDAGATWSVPLVLNGDTPFVGDQFFPWIEVDEQGRLHVVYFDTRYVNQSDTDPAPLMDATYAVSFDEGASWTEYRLTSTSFETQYDGFGGAFLGDYVGLAAAGGIAIPSYLTTELGTASDGVVNVVNLGPAQEFCRGLRCPCGNDDSRAGCGNNGFDGDPSTGASLTADGSTSIAADDLVLTLSGVQPGQFGLIFAGTARREVQLGEGKLCLGGVFRRYPIFQADALGEGRTGPGQVVSLAIAAGFSPTVGQTLFFQGVYRDSGGPCNAGLNTSNALAVTWEL